ncbi:type I-E CRISPR-associated protein Cas6/Cse3/CasE [Streptomyces yaizuensis]|uniref:Type I-E CRISPR-associated protein Cas6/Cse3/CasE n=1 Tax=Streptomyces yaizuensis TaxID=2989713 RepID=A0ABQ5P6F1_9ACTN|nr:type I-E CRISPR-associated protein Cas6/Cse3/CasE [Streptomyces sp. YSPA8]GLF98164.1 type I-E CRISPR-associated protein Cas6/Cse3/CasE [Streptomyces sp. YSPA8]
MTHYLTRIHLNPARPHLTASPQRLHAAVAAAFPPSPQDSQDGRTLWRLDETRHPYRQQTLLVVSPAVPDLTHVVEQAGWPRTATPGNPGWDTRPYTPLLDKLRPGVRLRFRLTANPTKAIRRPGRPDRRGVRTALTTPADQLQWLTDRSPTLGFTLPTTGGHPQTAVTASDALDFHRTGNHSRGDRVRIRAVTFDGHLRVTDPDALRRTLTHGIGHGRAYGCGLLTLAPPS